MNWSSFDNITIQLATESCWCQLSVRLAQAG